MKIMMILKKNAGKKQVYIICASYKNNMTINLIDR